MISIHFNLPNHTNRFKAKTTTTKRVDSVLRERFPGTSTDNALHFKHNPSTVSFAAINRKRTNTFGLTQLKQRNNAFLSVSGEQFRQLTQHVEAGLKLIQAQQYEKAIQHFSNKSQAKQCGIRLSLFKEMFPSVPVQEELNEFLIKRAGTTFKIIPEDNRIILYQAHFVNAPQTAIDKETFCRINYNLAYAGMEEWLHAVQYASGQNLSRQFRNARPGDYHETSPLEELDVAAFCIEQGIPIPRDYLKVYDREKFVHHDSKTLWGKYASFPDNSIELGCDPKQPSITSKIRTLRVGDSLTIGRMNAGALIHITPNGFAQLILSDIPKGAALGIPDHPIVKVTKKNKNAYQVEPLIQPGEPLAKEMTILGIVNPQDASKNVFYSYHETKKIPAMKAKTGQSILINGSVFIELP